MQAVAKAFGLGDNENKPCPRPLNIRKVRLIAWFLY
jgi:hypothetical protein